MCSAAAVYVSCALLVSSISYVLFHVSLFVFAVSLLDATAKPGWVSAMLGVERAAKDSHRALVSHFCYNT